MESRERERRGTMLLGGLLLIVGAAALAGRGIGFDIFDTGWPLFVIAPGVLLFALALNVGGAPGSAIAVPAGIVTMVGLVLAVQSATGLWATWAYGWALVAPGGVGAGLTVYGLLTGQREFIRAGTPVLAAGLGLFLDFGIFFEGVLGLSGPAILGAETFTPPIVTSISGEAHSAASGFDGWHEHTRDSAGIDQSCQQA